MDDRITGIILKQSDYRDQATLIRVLTKEVGKISLIVQGAKKLSGKRTALQPYTTCEFLFDYREDKDIFRLKNSSVLRMPRTLYADLHRSLAAGVLAEITDEVTMVDQGVEWTAIYQLLDLSIAYLEDGKDCDLVLAVFLSDVLNMIGLSPAVDGCAICGDTVVSAKSAREGGFLCADHAQSSGVPLDTRAHLHQFRLICKANVSQLPIIEGAVDNASMDLMELVDFYRIHAGMSVKSFDLYKKIHG